MISSVLPTSSLLELFPGELSDTELTEITPGVAKTASDTLHRLASSRTAPLDPTKIEANKLCPMPKPEFQALKLLLIWAIFVAEVSPV